MIIKMSNGPTVPYETMYKLLFNEITTALNLIEDKQLMKARAVLMDAQRKAEELYIEGIDGIERDEEIEIMEKFKEIK